MARGKPFPKGNKHGKGGKRPGAGRPTNAELEAKATMLEVWERKIQAREEALAKRYVDQAFLDNKVLIDLRKTRLPNA